MSIPVSIVIAAIQAGVMLSKNEIATITFIPIFIVLMIFVGFAVSGYAAGKAYKKFPD